MLLIYSPSFTGVSVFSLLFLFLLIDLSTSCFIGRSAMATAGGLPLPAPGVETDRRSWAGCVSLYRFVWAVRRRCLSSYVLRAVPGRAALAIWVGGLGLREFRLGAEALVSPDTPSGDERMLDRIVASVRSGWTTR